MAGTKETVQHNDEGTMTIVLQRPVKLADRTLDKITMRRAKVRDVLEVAPGSKSEDDKEVRLIAKLSGNNPEDLHDVDYADWQRVQQVFLGFLQ